MSDFILYPAENGGIFFFGTGNIWIPVGVLTVESAFGKEALP